MRLGPLRSKTRRFAFAFLSPLRPRNCNKKKQGIQKGKERKIRVSYESIRANEFAWIEIIGESSRGNTIRGNRTGEPLRGKSASERVSESEGFQRFSEVVGGFEKLLEVFRGFQRFFRGFQRSSKRPSQTQISSLSYGPYSCCPLTWTSPKLCAFANRSST